MKLTSDCKDISLVMNSLRKYIESANFAGYDPYDALNSSFLALLCCNSKWARVALTQFMRRCPINLRPLLGVGKAHNPKAIGLFVSGYAKLFAIDPNEKYLQKVDYLLNLLEQLKCTGYNGNCWGYNFDWQNRTLLLLKGVPTIVNSSFIGHSLLDCYELTGKQQALEMAISIKDFICKDLNRTKLRDTICFSYTPADCGVVHNANMLGASILIRLNKYCPSELLIETALASLDYSMNHQHSDGSWYYADTDGYRWIDSFHTGFNLQALRCILNDGFASQYQEKYEKGVEFYADNFFLADGYPKYYHNQSNLVDIHAPTQAIYFFAGMGEQYKVLTDRILKWMLNNMQSPSGYFYFRKSRYFTNKISYMRWAQAWVFHALAEYLFQKSASRSRLSQLAEVPLSY
jgi:rhamnogalacturonyl hydrolase YesR